VSTLLDEVEVAAQALNRVDPSADRQKLVDALQQLATRLLEHLAFEEESLAGVLGSWRRWPFLG
jgi:hypothetical protein